VWVWLCVEALRMAVLRQIGRRLVCVWVWVCLVHHCAVRSFLKARVRGRRDVVDHSSHRRRVHLRQNLSHVGIANVVGRATILGFSGSA
jgi:hypothetical protein